MAIENRTLRADHDHRVKERRPAELIVDFIDPDNDRCLMFCSGVLKWL